MTFKSVHELADFINQHHYRFAEHRIFVGCENVNTFGTLMRAISYLKKEKAAQSANFDAEIMVRGLVIPSTITIGITEDGISYTECVNH